MAYNKELLWVPDSYTTIKNTYFDRYNQGLSELGLTPVTEDHFDASIPRFALETSIELDLQTEVILGNLYNRIVDFLDLNQSQQQSEVKGSASLGLYNALLAVEGVERVSIDNPNKNNTTVTDGQIAIALEFTDDDKTKELIWTAIYENKAVGVLTKVNATTNFDYTAGADDGGNVTYNWTNFVEKRLVVNLTFQYSNNYNGNRIVASEIAKIYLERFNSIYNGSQDIEPDVLNDVSEYPKQESPPYVLSQLDSQFSIDDGITYLPVNEILSTAYNEIYTLILSNITVSEV